MRKKLFTTAVSLVLAGLIPNVCADVKTATELGVGARSYAFANNSVALSNDFSAAYWNPAALSFMPVREFQIALDGFSFQSTQELSGTSVYDDLQRLRLANTGLLVALPTSRGGFSLAGFFFNPVLFDDVVSFKGTAITGAYSTDIDRTYKSSGGLRQWGASFGIQVAPGTGVGASLSLVTGSEKSNHYYRKLTNGLVNQDSVFYHDFIETGKDGYIGYDLRAGLLYKYGDNLNFGLRVVAPQVIAFHEDIDHLTEGTNYEYESTGRLYSSLSMAGGAALTLPFMTVSLEARGKAPYRFLFPTEEIPLTSQARYFKTGAGVGIEVPVLIAPLVARAGYSFDEYDLHPYIVRYDGDQENDPAVWSDEEEVVDRNLNTITGGVGIITGNVSLEFSYGYQTWSLTTRKTLHQEFAIHRLLAALSIRY